MESKKKLCAGCNTEQYIWKKDGRDRYCKNCWSRINAGKQLKKTPLKQKSSKLQENDKLYTQLRRTYLEKNPTCEFNISGICTNKASEIHHKAYRGVNHNNIETWAAVCRACHNWVHANPKEARELKYLK